MDEEEENVFVTEDELEQLLNLYGKQRVLLPKWQILEIAGEALKDVNGILHNNLDPKERVKVRILQAYAAELTNFFVENSPFFKKGELEMFMDLTNILENFMGEIKLTLKS